MNNKFIVLSESQFNETRDAIHLYAIVLGNWLKQCREPRKHWWHASLRPSLNGLTTGVIQAPVNFEFELNLRDSLLVARSDTGEQEVLPLLGQPANDLVIFLDEFLKDIGLEDKYRISPNPPTSDKDSILSDSDFSKVHDRYSAEVANDIAVIISAVSGVMALFRSRISQECSPIQLWPHHFDLSMVWLPGEKMAGQDPNDEEYSDKQMNFGFTFGDELIPEPYFYITAYPLPATLPSVILLEGSQWYSSSNFSGAVLKYEDLLGNSDPAANLLSLWRSLLYAGIELMMDKSQ